MPMPLPFLPNGRNTLQLDYEKIYHSMVKPAFLFDGRNLLDHKKLYEIGFNVYPIGKPPLTHLTYELKHV